MDESTKIHKAAEIFQITGEALTKVSELIMQLNPQVEAPPGSKWTEDEIELLRKAVNQFGTDVQKISEIVKTRSATQLKNALKRKIYATDQQNQQLGQQQFGGSQPGKEPTAVGTTIAQATITTPTTIGQQQQQSQKQQQQAQTVKYEPVENLTTETVPFEDFHHHSTIEPPSGEPPSKKTCNPETVGHMVDPLLDVENLDDSNSSFKKLDNFISSRPSVESRTVGGVNELAVSNPPLVPPLDIHSDTT